MDDRERFLQRIARLEALVASQEEVIRAQAARIAELEAELRRLGKEFVPKANATSCRRRRWVGTSGR